MPLEPPMMRMREERSLEVYFVASDMAAMIGGK
jgi:hypothetical protein